MLRLRRPTHRDARRERRHPFFFMAPLAVIAWTHRTETTTLLGLRH
ncbi:hypothetical protein ACFQ2M_35530 [Kitasatospora saccharophila]